MSYVVREMQATDWDAVAVIYKQGMDTGLATFQSECPSYEEWDKGHVKNCRLVITEDDVVLGWTALSAVSGRCVYAGVAEVSLYIHQDARKKGLGRMLMSELIQCSEEEGFWMLQSGIMQNNEASIRLHTSCGFRMVGYRERIGKDVTGTWRNTVLMEKRSDKEYKGDGCAC